MADETNSAATTSGSFAPASPHYALTHHLHCHVAPYARPNVGLQCARRPRIAQTHNRTDDHIRKIIACAVRQIGLLHQEIACQSSYIQRPPERKRVPAGSARRGRHACTSFQVKRHLLDTIHRDTFEAEGRCVAQEIDSVAGSEWWRKWEAQSSMRNGKEQCKVFQGKSSSS